MKMRQTLHFSMEDKNGRVLDTPESQAVARCVTLLLGVEDLLHSLHEIAASDKTPEEQEALIRVALALHLKGINGITMCDLQQTHADVRTVVRKLGLELENIPVQAQQEGLVH